MNPALKALVFEDFINKTKSELDDFTQLIGEIMSNSNELAGEAFDANTYITQHKREIRDMYLKNMRPMQVAQELISGIKRQY